MEFTFNPYILFGGGGFVIGGMFAGLNGHPGWATTLSVIGLIGSLIASPLSN